MDPHEVSRMKMIVLSMHIDVILGLIIELLNFLLNFGMKILNFLCSLFGLPTKLSGIRDCN